MTNTAPLITDTLSGPVPFEGKYQTDARDTLDLPSLTQAKVWNGANDPALPGNLITYTIAVNNIGKEVASDVVITDTPDSLGEFVVGSVVASADGTVVLGNNPGDTSIEVEFVSLAVSAIADVSYQVAISNPWLIEPQILTNQAVVDSTELTSGVSDWPVDPVATDPTLVTISAGVGKD